MKKKLFLVLLLVAANAHADQNIRINCEPPTKRENGAPLEIELKFQLFLDGELVEEKSDCTFETALKKDSNFLLYVVDADGLRSMPGEISFTLPKSPPAKPQLRGEYL